MTHYAADGLIAFAQALLRAGGLDAAKATVVAEILVEGDLLGHTTHGLALLAAYLNDLENGGMKKSGVPQVTAAGKSAET